MRSRFGASLLGKSIVFIEVFGPPFCIVFLVTIGDAGEHPLAVEKAKSCFDLGGLLGAVDPGEEPSQFAKEDEC